MEKEKPTHNIQRMPPAIKKAVSPTAPKGTDSSGNDSDFAPPEIRVRSQSIGHCITYIFIITSS